MSDFCLRKKGGQRKYLNVDLWLAGTENIVLLHLHTKQLGRAVLVPLKASGIEYKMTEEHFETISSRSFKKGDMSVLAALMCLVPWSPEEGVGYPGTGVTDGCEL